MTIEARFGELIHFVPLFPELVLNLLRSHINALMEIFEASFALVHLGDVYFATSGFEGLAAFVAEKLWEYALIASNSLKRVVALVIFDLFTLDWFDAEMWQKLVEQVVQLDLQEGKVTKLRERQDIFSEHQMRKLFLSSIFIFVLKLSGQLI